MHSSLKHIPRALPRARASLTLPQPQHRQLRACSSLLRPTCASVVPRAPASTLRSAALKKTQRGPDTSGRRAYSQKNTTPSGERDKATVGVFTPKAAALFVLAGAGLYFYFRWEKQRLLEAKEKEKESRSVGRAHVGGPFEMLTHEGKPFTEKDLLGKWSLIYFGFTNCPDICPDELDKMSAAVDEIDKAYGPIVQPIFISVDPARDTVPQVARYVADFHPRLIGLTGTYAAAKAACKAYRVYFSTPPDAQPGDDYLVDHSIFFYFMDPDGKFVDAFGKSSEAGDVVERVKREVEEWRAEKGRVV